MTKLLTEQELDDAIRLLLDGYDRGAADTKPFIDLIRSQKFAHAEPLLKMLDKLGVEKCHVCSEHLIDDDMNICESCNHGVHEWCTGYTYGGSGEYPSESAYAICKTCHKPEQRERGKS